MTVLGTISQMRIQNFQFRERIAGNDEVPIRNWLEFEAAGNGK